MNTTIQLIDRGAYRAMAGLVERLLPTLTWRHNGLGLLQAYVYEGTTDELRVHVWHPSLRKEGIEHSGEIHDHRFNLTSYVLYGEVLQTEYMLYEHPDGNWQTHTVVPARKAAARTDESAGWIDTLAKRYRAQRGECLVRAGELYTFPKREIHAALTTKLTVTLVAKADQDEIPARILAPYGAPVAHAFADPLPSSAWEGPLAEAAAALAALRA